MRRDQSQSTASKKSTRAPRSGAESPLKIGALARESGCDVETIRYYERKGLIARPSRTASNYRSYSHVDVTRLRFIRRCRTLDMTLDEIGSLLGMRDSTSAECAHVRAILDEHIRHVEERITELVDLQEQLRRIRKGCKPRRGKTVCGILDALGEPDHRTNATSHVSHTHDVTRAAKRS